MDYLAWLVGVIDGEGCFQIDKRGIPSLTVMVSYADSGLVDKCAAAAGVGIAKHYPNAPRVPVSSWVVKSKSDLMALVGLLDEYPLQGKKSIEYVVWREAVIRYQDRRTGGQAAARNVDNAPVTADLLGFRERLMALR